MLNMFRMGPSPHIRTSETVDKVMYDVIISLIPALLMAVYIFYWLAGEIPGFYFQNLSITLFQDCILPDN